MRANIASRRRHHGCPNLRAVPVVPARAARNGFLNMSSSSFEFQRAGIERLWWSAKWAVRSSWMRYLRHRQHMSDLAELAAMDDLSLKDTGITRGEIRAAIQGKIDLGPRSR